MPRTFIGIPAIRVAVARARSRELVRELRREFKHLRPFEWAYGHQVANVGAIIAGWP